MKYKGFKGSQIYSEEDKVFHGTIENIDDLVTFEADSEEELVISFREAVDDYLEVLNELSKIPKNKQVVLS